MSRVPCSKSDLSFSRFSGSGFSGGGIGASLYDTLHISIAIGRTSRREARR
jgi:hypothetical protein